MSERLRHRQTDLTKDLILNAVADVVADGRLADFSVQEVADRAGVSYRTVYRHFPDRDTLLEGLSTWLEQQMVERGGVAEPRTANEITDALEPNFSVMHQHASLIDALVTLRVVQGPPVGTQRRTEAFGKALAEETGHLSVDDAHAVAAGIRHLASSLTWQRFHREYDVPPAATTRAITWMIEELLEALRRGEGPTRNG